MRPVLVVPVEMESQLSPHVIASQRDGDATRALILERADKAPENKSPHLLPAACLTNRHCLPIHQPPSPPTAACLPNRPRTAPGPFTSRSRPHLPRQLARQTADPLPVRQLSLPSPPHGPLGDEPPIPTHPPAACLDGPLIIDRLPAAPAFTSHGHSPANRNGSPRLAPSADRARPDLPRPLA